MSVATYVGTTAFQEVQDAILTSDAWGMDHLTRTFEGRKSLLSAFLADYGKTRDKTDTEFPYLYYTNANATIGRAYARVTIEFKGLNTPGFNNSPIPLPPVFKSGYRNNDVQLQFVADTYGESTGATADITYSAPYTRIFYITREKPTQRLHRNELELAEEGFEILSRRGTPGTIKLWAGKSWRAAAGAPQGLINGGLQCFNGVLEVIPTQFEWEPVGQWYEVTEANEARIVPLDLANGGLQFIV